MQLEFFDVPSPCIGICQTDDKGYCLGCLRSRDERQIWKDFSNDQKQKVIKRCIQRKKRKSKRIEQVQSSDQPLAQVIENTLDEVVQPSLLESVNKLDLSQNDDIDFGDFDL